MYKFMDWIFGGSKKYATTTFTQDKEDNDSNDSKKSSGSSSGKSARFSINFDTSEYLEQEKSIIARAEYDRLMKEALEKIEKENEELKKEQEKEHATSIKFRQVVDSILSDRSNLHISSKIISPGITTIDEAENIFTEDCPRVIEFVIRSPLGLIKANIHNTFCSTSMYGSLQSKAMDYFNDPNFYIEDMEVSRPDGSSPESPRDMLTECEDLRKKLWLDIKSRIRMAIPPDFIDFKEDTVSKFGEQMILRRSISVEICNSTNRITAKIHHNNFDSGELPINPLSMQIEDEHFAILADNTTLPSHLSMQLIEDEIFRKTKSLGLIPSIGWDQVQDLMELLGDELESGLRANIFRSPSDHRITISTIKNPGRLIINNQEGPLKFMSYSTAHLKLSQCLNSDLFLPVLKMQIAVEEAKIAERESIKQRSPSRAPRL